MHPTFTKSNYPVFEANQVLSKRHLNQVFDYLDEQERLTRANLIGIGIVCGLEIKLGGLSTAPEVHISKGCGITSEGYLIIEPEELKLVSYKKYKQPTDVVYTPFKNLDMWEMFEAGEPNAILFRSNPAFLSDKVVVLLLELKKDSLRNCNPGNCDDKGAEVATTVRRLLILKSEMKKIIANANNLSISITPSDLKANLEIRLNLQDLALPRYNVPNTGLVSSFDLLSSYFRIFRDHKLATNTGKALKDLYTAFKPLLEEQYALNPFVNFKFDYIDTALNTTTEVRFLQYFYDLFDDLLRAYDEFRWKGLELLCACCPPETLFPRHLMLGLLEPDAEASIYRHTFLASGALHDCEHREEELRILFRRIVEMVAQFNDNPLFSQFQTRPYIVVDNLIDEDIRITPSKLGDVALSDKAIPYYYTQNNNTTLYQYWSPEKNRRLKVKQNLSYWAENYADRTFIQRPLEYDIEPYNFLRIEGHLGKNYKTVLRTLLMQRDRYILPISIVALRAGAFDEKIKLDLADFASSFEDLDALYHATREQWLGFLCKQLTYFYDLEASSAITKDFKPSFKSKFAFINKYAPGFLVNPARLGGMYEKPQKVNDSSKTILKPRTSAQNFDADFFIIFTRILDLADSLPLDLSGFSFTFFDTRYKSMLSAVVKMEADREGVDGKGDLRKRDKFLVWEELDDRLEDLMYSCRTEGFKSIYDEYLRRLKAIKQKQFLSHFLQQHPGIQHKAGVTVGGTFILVYHDDPDPMLPPMPVNTEAISIAEDLNTHTQTALVESANTEGLPHGDFSDSLPYKLNYSEQVIAYKALTNIGYNKELMSTNKHVRDLVTLLTGQVTNLELDDSLVVVNSDEFIIRDAVDDIADETVIADFYLPYLCCSDFTPVQFVLPSIPVSFTVKLGCTDAETKKAPATITVHSGAGPFYFNLDKQGFLELKGAILLNAGKHEIILRDANNMVSGEQEIIVPEPLTITTPKFKCYFDNSKMTYEVSFDIQGGSKPYATDSGSLKEESFTSKRVASGTGLIVNITDDADCKFSKSFTYECSITRDIGDTNDDNTNKTAKRVIGPSKSARTKTKVDKEASPVKETLKSKFIKAKVTTPKSNKSAAVKAVSPGNKPTPKKASKKLVKVVSKKVSSRKKK